MVNKKKIEKKIHVEQLAEDAWDWWNNQSDPWMQENSVIPLYMKAKGIKKCDVQW